MILVVAEHSLVLEVVSGALRGRGLEVERALVSEVAGGDDLRHPTRVAAVALLLDDLTTPASFALAVATVPRLPSPCVLSTGTPPSPAWGAMLDAGVATVLESSVGLDEVVAALEGRAHGHQLSSRRRLVLVRAWEHLRTRRDLVRARVASLAPRQRSVLELLHRGAGVVDIAAAHGVSTSTVRSQVRVVLARLDAATQLEAVAIYSEFLDDGHRGLRQRA